MKFVLSPDIMSVHIPFQAPVIWRVTCSLEEIAYIFRLALLRMIDGNTYHKGIVMVPRCEEMIFYGTMRITARRCNGQSASFSARQNINMRKTGFVSPFAQSLPAIPLLLA